MAYVIHDQLTYPDLLSLGFNFLTRMLGPVIKVIIFAIFCHWLRITILTLDFTKFIYNHAPGPCQLVEGVEHGSEDIEILSNGFALISTGLRYLGGDRGIKSTILLMDLNNPKKKPIELKFLGDFDAETANFHGISKWVDKSTGAISLFVVNHPKLPQVERVEIFEFDSKKNTLLHKRTITDENINSINNLVAVGPDSFYYTNDRYFRTYNVYLTVALFYLPLGNVGYYNGKKGQIIENYHQMPNGINISPDKKYLYIASFVGRALYSYEIKADKSIVLKEKTPLYSNIDNINVDPETGDIWAGLSPVAHQIFYHLFFDHSRTTSSQVLKFSMNGAKVKSITEVYANNGEHFSMCSAAAVYKNHLLVGSVDQRLLYCQIKSF